MSATAPERHSAATMPPSSTPKRYTLEQEAFVHEFNRVYGIEPEQISFDSERLEPVFDFEALNLLAIKLGDFPSIITELGDVDATMGLATASCEIKLVDGRVRSVFGAAMVGEALPKERLIEDIPQALNVAQARALRKGLRAVGWDALRAHREQGDNTLTFNLSHEAQLVNNELAEIHILAKEIGLITTEGDKTNYYRTLDIYFPGVKSASELNDAQRAQLIATFRALKSARSTTTHPALAANAEAAANG